MKKTKTVSYIEPGTGRRITKEVEIPPPAKIKDLPCGASVQEISNMEALTALWADDVASDLVTPLTHQTRQILADELKKALTEGDEHQAIDALTSTWQPPDDVALKVLQRLAKAVRRQRQKRERNVNTAVQLQHEKGLLEEKVKRLEEENKALHTDVKQVVDERDALKAAAKQRVDFSRQDKEAREARAALRQEADDHRCTQVRLVQTEQALTEAIKARTAAEQERDVLMRDAERNLEIALNEYEGAVVDKLAAVAADHNEKAKEVDRLKEELTALKGERNILRSQIDDHKNKLQQVKVEQKERVMSETENVTTESETLRCGDEVYCKVSSEGPFVLMTQVDEAYIEYANPISGRKSSFNCGKLPVANAWLTRCRDGSYRTYPAAALTKAAPKRTMSFGGVKRLVTSDVTAKLFQAAIWIAILTALFMRG